MKYNIKDIVYWLNLVLNYKGQLQLIPHLRFEISEKIVLVNEVEKFSKIVAVKI